MLFNVFHEFNKRLGEFGRVVIAGGAVRDSLLGREPKDFDVFVLHDQGVKFEAMKKVIVPRLEDLSSITPVVDWHKSEPFLVAMVIWQGREIQVMANPAADVKRLVDTFDWSVCLYAFDGMKITAREPVENIKPGNDLWLQKVTFPLSTLRRGFRFSERFKMKLQKKDIEDLCRRILKSDFGREPDMPALAANALVEEP